MEHILVICEVGRLAIALKLIVIKRDCERINKFNHPIQNPLLFVTEPRTRDSINSAQKTCHLRNLEARKFVSEASYCLALTNILIS
jgi:hypothetical protein